MALEDRRAVKARAFDFPAVDDNHAGRRRVEAGEDVERRRLAAVGMADDADERAAILARQGRVRIDLPDFGTGINIGRRTAPAGGKVFGRGGAAELLDVKPTTLASRIETLGIRYERGAPAEAPEQRA